MSISGKAQLRPDDTDASGYFRRLDVNDNVCAIIKVRPTQAMNAPLIINTAGGMSAVPPPDGVANRQEDGSWWYWLPSQVKNIYFTAAGYTQTETFGVSLQSGKVYELQLVVDATVHQMQEFSLEKYVMKLDITPRQCVVSYGADSKYDMDRVVVEDGYFEAVLNKGFYYYKVENDYYETFTGTYRLDKSSSEVTIAMKPAYGFLKVETEPAGAEVYLDGSLQSAGKTPFQTQMLTGGSHRIRLRKENYYTQEILQDVAPTGEVQNVPIIRLKPQFGTVTCMCDDSDAELVVTDASGKQMGKGKSGMRIHLNSRGSYKLEASKPGHAPQSVGIQGGPAFEGKILNVTVGSPVPVYGGLQISSEPRRAEVYIDGKFEGKTTWAGEVLVGNHQVELRMEEYPSLKFNVTVEKDQETVLSKKLEKNLAKPLDSSGKTANCYIVSAPGTYSFPTVKGNSSESVGYVASVEVLWESFGTATAPFVGELISKVSYASGNITFSTPSALKNGNAVIAAMDASGNILWSWHIWICKDYDPVATAHVYYNNAGTMMDRNLGATSATPGDVGALGLLYQWGRKDPFLGGSSISSNTKAASTLSWPSAVASNSSNGTIAYAVAHPTTFIMYNSSNYDWYYTGSGSTDNTRWQSTKTIYDPCPPGWKIPTGGSSGIWSKACGTSSEFFHTWDSTNKEMNFSGKFGASGTIWYPAAAYLYSDDGSLSHVGYYGYWWSCTPNDFRAYVLILYSSGYVVPSDDSGRASGRSVRCLQE